MLTFTWPTAPTDCPTLHSMLQLIAEPESKHKHTHTHKRPYVFLRNVHLVEEHTCLILSDGFARSSLHLTHAQCIQLPLLLDNPNYVSARFRDSRVALTTLYGITVTNQSIELPELGKEATKSTNVQALVQLHRDAAHIYNTSCARASTLPYNQFALLLHLNATAHVGAARKVPISMSSVIQVLCTIPSSPIGPPSNSTTTTTAVPATSQTAQFEFSTFPVSDIPPCLRP
eukprot:m.181257 g.181257  ORF g.181257 m.181257 type:complete len:230 (-) comp14662_c1_seq19:2667-3356(-)